MPREIKTTKILCHPDGSPFAAWDPQKLGAYAMYFTDEDTPPAADALAINGGGGRTDHATLVWCVVRQIVDQPDGGVSYEGGTWYVDTGQTI
jgi:hypothetical protein